MAAFGRELGVELEAVSFMRELPIEVQGSIIANFDPSGTKDGNVIGRLQAYARQVIKRNGLRLPDSFNNMPQPRRDSAPPPAAPVGPLGALAHQHFAAPVEHATGSAPPWTRPGGGSGGGMASGESIWSFSERLGLGDAGASFLSGLPEELQQSVLRGFDPSGTKDGNVWGRLFGYCRSLWSRRLHLNEQASAFIRGLPEEVQMAVMLDFDATGSKDGNVSARLMQFAGYVASRGGAPPRGAAAAPVGAPIAPLRPPVPPPALNLAPPGSPIAEFAYSLGVEPDAVAFLEALPEEVQATLLASFDPSSSKDGNIWGRLFAFARRTWAKHVGSDQITVAHLKGLPEEEQRRLIIEWTPPSASVSNMGHAHPGGNFGGLDRRSAVQQFVHHWGLDDRIAAFLHALPEMVRDHVVSGFDGSGTKDGNVWGRLLGFIRATWARSLGLDQASVATIKALPEDAQMICLTDFDPSGTKDGNVAGRLQGFVRKAMAQAGHSSRGPGGPGAAGTAISGGSSGYGGHAAHASQPVHTGSYGGHIGHAGPGVDALAGRGPVRPARPGLAADPAVQGFLARCGLDASAVSLLESLSEEGLATAIHDFDPSGTKDGNVLGRLQGYVRLLNARRKRVAEDHYTMPAKRPCMGAY